MLLAGRAGAVLEVDSQKLRADQVLFSESSGFVLEVPKEKAQALEKLVRGFNVLPIPIGETGGKSLVVRHNKKKLVDLTLNKMRKAWDGGLREAMK
jgi:phosphoribosylformylglycinamidine synthase